MNRYLVSLMAATMAVSTNAFADKTEKVLSLDRAVPPFVYELTFPQGEELLPEQSDFEVVNYLFMSSDSGERWATVTLRNKSAGQRLLVRKHLVGVFADGSRRHPVSLDETFKGEEQAAYTIFFGRNNFPLIYIESR